MLVHYCHFLFQTFTDIVFYIFIASFTIQGLYYVLFYSRSLFWKKREDVQNKIPVSVVICARNEAENLSNNLPCVLEQDYDDFEVVVVNDCSIDNTSSVLDNFSVEYDKLYVTTIKEDEKFSHNKKLALTIGIKAAKHEYVLLTDADCRPVSKNWISTFAAKFSDNTTFILGYGGYEKRKGLLNRLIRYDTFFIALQYLGFAKAGIPYMGVGRNIAYRKSVFLSSNGFSKHVRLRSGDDDLFINRNARAKNTVINLDKDSITCSVPEKSFKAWVRQKQRHFSASKYYKFWHKLLLALEPLSRLFYYLSFFILIVYFEPLKIILSLFSIRILYQTVIFYCFLRRIKELDLLYLSPVFDIIFPLVNLFIVIPGTKKGKKYYGR